MASSEVPSGKPVILETMLLRMAPNMKGIKKKSSDGRERNCADGHLHSSSRSINTNPLSYIRFVWSPPVWKLTFGEAAGHRSARPSPTFPRRLHSSTFEPGYVSPPQKHLHRLTATGTDINNHMTDHLQFEPPMMISPTEEPLDQQDSRVKRGPQDRYQYQGMLRYATRQGDQLLFR